MDSDGEKGFLKGVSERHQFPSQIWKKKVRDGCRFLLWTTTIE